MPHDMKPMRIKSVGIKSMNVFDHAKDAEPDV